MKIIEENHRHGLIKLQIETIDDLWVLYNILRENDIVYSKTTRDVKIGDNSTGTRIPMILGLRVKHIEFQQFSNKLRIRGIVIDGPEEYGVRGKYHTLSLGLGDVLSVIKEKWSEFELEMIRDFTIKKGSVLILSIDLDEACIGLLREQGVRYLWDSVLNLPSKVYQVDYDNVLKDFIETIVDVLLNYLREEDIKALIIAGPGDVKYRVKSSVENRVNVSIYIDSTSTGGCQGIREVLNRDIVKDVLGYLNIVRARGILDRFKELLVKDEDLVSYGVRYVHEASLIGSIEKLLVLDKLLRSPDDVERNTIYETLINAYKYRAEVIVVPGNSDVGLELEGLGGIIAILRFKLYKTSVYSP